MAYQFLSEEEFEHLDVPLAHLQCSRCEMPVKPCAVVHRGPEGGSCRALYCSNMCALSSSTCTECPARLALDSLPPVHPVLLTIINRLKVRCNYCKEVMRQGEAQEHVTSICESVEVPCQGAPVGCAFLGTREQVAEHEEQCAGYKTRNLVITQQRLIEQQQQQLEVQQRQISDLQGMVRATVARLPRGGSRRGAKRQARGASHAGGPPRHAPVQYSLPPPPPSGMPPPPVYRDIREELEDEDGDEESGAERAVAGEEEEEEELEDAEGRLAGQERGAKWLEELPESPQERKEVLLGRIAEYLSLAEEMQEMGILTDKRRSDIRQQVGMLEMMLYQACEADPED